MIALAYIDSLELWLKFLIAVLTFLVTAGGAFVAFLKWLRAWRDTMVRATTGYMQQLIKRTLEREALKRDPSEFWTLGIEFEGGHKMAVPMFPGFRVMVAENIEMAVQDHGKDQTELGLWCEGFGTLKRHCHSDNCETVHVERGTVTHLETGRVYRKGETWTIEQGEWHSALFADCYCRVIHRPPLPSAAVRPVNLDAMKSVFPP